MKLLTLNTQSLIGEDFPLRAESFFEALLRERPDVMALQEVNQSPDAPTVSTEDLSRFVPCGGSVPLRADNYAYWLSEKLSAEGIRYFWTWFPIKRGYGRYDEGLAIFSRFPIETAEAIYLSPNRDYEDWHTRLALAVRCADRPQWFYNAHMSRWSSEGGFLFEWERLRATFPEGEEIWLMGDFNNPAEARNEGYDRITADGFFDAYLLAEDRRGRETARRGIDGWSEERSSDGIRIDQIWCRPRASVLRYRTVFDGVDLPVVSDHFGVMLETGEVRGGEGV